MPSSNNQPDKNPDHSAFMGWGAIAGGLIGAIIGVFAGNWFLWAFLVGVVGLTVGALIDRSRR